MNLQIKQKTLDKISKLIIKAIVDKNSLDEKLIIAIDGNSGSGKTSVALKLRELLNASLFRMDDFFLRPEQRTLSRLNEPGGNVDYERFQEEILLNIRKSEKVALRRFNCREMIIEEPSFLEIKDIVLVEGVYSMHPELINYYDFKIFMMVDEDVQIERIEQRDGREKLKYYKNSWIPMENHYFQTLKIKEKSDLVIDTTTSER